MHISPILPFCHSPFSHSAILSFSHAHQVVERKVDLYLHTTAIKKWDICAGDAILRTVGGKMTTRKGKEIDYSLEGDPKNSDGIIAAFTEVKHEEYLNKLKL